MSGGRVPVTIVNHAAVDIAAPRDAVWKMIVEEYVETGKFRETGFAIDPLDDPGAVLGGYRMRLRQDGVVVDDRLCRITERNDAERRLSMFAEYLSPPGGILVFATYHAQDAPGGTRFALDCHARLELDVAAEQDPAAAVAAMTQESEAALVGYLEAVKAKLEAEQPQ